MTIRTRRTPPTLLALMGFSLQAIAQQQTVRQPLVFAGSEKTRVSAACERAIRLNLNGPATTGDVEQACRCVNNAFAAAESSIQADDAKNFISARPEGEVLNPEAINNASEGEDVKGTVRIAAQRLGWEIRSCTGMLPTRGQLWGRYARDWKDEPDRYMDYLGPIVAPTPGAASPANNDLGGLLFVRLQHVRQAIYDLTMMRGSDQTARAAWKNAEAFVENFGRGASEFVVLSCQYRAQAENGYNQWLSTKAYFFWYRPKWTSAANELTASASAESPLKQIGPAVDSCPVREPKQ